MTAPAGFWGTGAEAPGVGAAPARYHKRETSTPAAHSAAVAKVEKLRRSWDTKLRPSVQGMRQRWAHHARHTPVAASRASISAPGQVVAAESGGGAITVVFYGGSGWRGCVGARQIP